MCIYLHTERRLSRDSVYYIAQREPDQTLGAAALTAPAEQLDMPHNIEAEQGLLGTVLVNDVVLDRVASLRPEHFYDPLHAPIRNHAHAQGAGQWCQPVHAETFC